MPDPNRAVIQRIESKRRCASPERHQQLQSPNEWGDLLVSESLNPEHYIRYTTCGLCAGLLEIQSIMGKPYTDKGCNQ